MPTRMLCLLALALVVASPPALRGAEALPVPACDRVRFEPVRGSERAMVGAKIEGSNSSRADGYVTLATVEQPPAAGSWNEVQLPNTKLYRWLRMAMPDGTSAKIGRVEFYAGERLLGGEGRGVKFTPFAEGRDAVNDSAVGYDVFESATTNRPSFSPAGGDLDGPIDLKLGGPKGATIRYTLDGSTPTAGHGETYTLPIRIEKNTTVNAIAIAADRQPSLAVPATYLIKGHTAPALSTAHLGNSLTGTAGGFWRYARTAGRPHQQVAFLRPGALTRELWAVATGAYRDDKVANAKETKAQERGTATWRRTGTRSARSISSRSNRATSTSRRRSPPKPNSSSGSARSRPTCNRGSTPNGSS